MTKIPALIVRQWLKPEWDETKFEPAPPRGKPEPHFYLLSISAYGLKRLTGVYRRDPSRPPAEDMGIQRRHMPERSIEILRYLQDGFPLSRIDRKKLVDQKEVSSLRMPGWIPTAIVVNILSEEDKRGVKKRKVAKDDLVKIHRNKDVEDIAEIELPEHLYDPGWQPIIHPIEVIDGQHRLWALEEPEEDEKKWSTEFKEKIERLQIPVVAFHGLDVTWQAYLFYTINQLPKRIDTSMAFDLYPLLRDAEWLLRFEGPNIYRETRAQDLTILLWAHPESPWKDRIIRLGGREKGKVTQASFLRSLTASFMKRWHGGPKYRIGGLFGAPLGSHQTQLNWGREQQAAFLIMGWQKLRAAVTASTADWALALVKRYAVNGNESDEISYRDLLFSGPDTILATDQGVRGYLSVLNDLLWIAYDNDSVELGGWDWTRKTKHNDNEAISDALSQLPASLPIVVEFVQDIASDLADFDWRLPSAISPKDTAFDTQSSYRGSSGYRQIRYKMLVHLRDKENPPISQFASDLIDALNYENEEE